MLTKLIEEYRETEQIIKGMGINRNTPKNKQIMYEACRLGEDIVAEVMMRHYKNTTTIPIPHTDYTGDFYLKSSATNKKIMIEVKTESYKSNNIFFETSSKGILSHYLKVAKDHKDMLLIYSYPDQRNKIIIFKMKDLLPHLLNNTIGRAIKSRYNTTGILLDSSEAVRAPGYVATLPILPHGIGYAI